MMEGGLGAVAGRIDRAGMPVDHVLVERVLRMRPAVRAVDPASVGFVLREQGLRRAIALEPIAAEHGMRRPEPTFAIAGDRQLRRISFTAAAPGPGVAEP